MTKTELHKEITEVWKDLGRDVSKLNLTTKSEEELEDGLEKLKAIRMGFKLLFTRNGNHNLAISLLANVFGTVKEEEKDG